MMLEDNITRWVNEYQSEKRSDSIREVAKKLLNRGLSIPRVADCTGLTEKQVREISRELPTLADA